MANLRTLRVGSENLPLKLVPEVLPKLRHLFVHTRTPGGICHSRLREILESTEGGLGSLDTRLRDFSINTLDLLTSLCPQLRRLTVGYTAGSPPEPGALVLARPPISWYNFFLSRQYPDWPLEYLRLGTIRVSGYLDQECGELLPDAEMMDFVAEAVCPRMVEKDASSPCHHAIYPSMDTM
jgi:hypothetical protein